MPNSLSVNLKNIMRQSIVSSLTCTLYINGTDYSSYLSELPELKYDTDPWARKVDFSFPNNNVLRQMVSRFIGAVCSFSWGAYNLSGAPDMCNLFSGIITGVEIIQDAIKLSAQDKRYKISNVLVSSYLRLDNPAGMWLELLTRPGSLSSTDIDNEAHVKYRTDAGSQHLLFWVQSMSTGQGVQLTQAIEDLMQQTDSVTGVNLAGKLYPIKLPYFINSYNWYLSDHNCLAVEAKYNLAELVNRVETAWGRNSSNNTASGYAIYSNSASVQSWGTQEKKIESSCMRYIEAYYAYHYALQHNDRNSYPKRIIDVTLPIWAVQVAIGDTALITCSRYNITSRYGICREVVYNLQTGVVKATFEEAAWYL